MGKQTKIHKEKEQAASAAKEYPKLLLAVRKNMNLHSRMESMQEHAVDLQQILSLINSSKMYKVYRIAVGVRRIVLRCKPYASFSLYRRLISKENIRHTAAWIWNRLFLAKNVDIIVFGIISYRYRRQRPQHLSEWLGLRRYRVFYIENGFIPFTGQLKKRVNAPITVYRQTSNVFLVSLAATRDVSIYRETASTEDKKRIFSSLDNMREKFGIRKSVVIVEHPFWSQIAPYMNAPVIYDCMDEHVGFKGTSLVMSELERSLVRQSSAVVVTSKYLEKKMERLRARNITIIPNAGDSAYFSSVRRKAFPVPEDMKSVKRPSIGYYGAISEWFDAKVIRQLAEHMKSCSIVLIGEVTNDAVADLGRKYSNVHILGEKPYDALLPYVRQFDVCIIPFRLTALTKATNPVKIFEYFATGKPVVASALPELAPYGDLIYTAHSLKGWVLQTQRALAESDVQYISRRRAIASANTWDHRGHMLEQVVQRQTKEYYVR